MAVDTSLVEQAVAGFTVPHLRTIAGLYGWPLSGLRRDDLIAQMVAHYNNPTAVEAALATVPERDRHLLALIAWTGWMKLEQLVKALETVKALLPRDWEVTKPERSALLDLVQRGLLLQRAVGGPVMELGVPPAFIPHLLPIPELVPPVKQPRGLREQPPMPLDPMGMLTIVWQILRQQPPLKSKLQFRDKEIYIQQQMNGGAWPIIGAERTVNPWDPGSTFVIPATTSIFEDGVLAQIRSAIGLDEAGIAEFFAALTQILEITQLVDEQSLEVVDEAFHRLLNTALAEQIDLLLHGWFKLEYTAWDEFSLVHNQLPHLTIKRRAGAWNFSIHQFNAHLVKMRSQIVEMLRGLPGPGGQASTPPWADFESFSRLLGGVFPFLIAPTERNKAWMIVVDKGDRLDPENPKDWARGPAIVLEHIFMGPLRWLGLVETALNSVGRLTGVRLTALGAALLQQKPWPDEQAVPPRWVDPLSVEVQPTRGTGPLIALLFAVADPTQAGQGRIVFRFTPDAAHRGFEEGHSFDDIKARFDQHGLPLPASVQEALGRWWSRWGLAHRYDNMALIEVADALLVNELLNATNIGQYVVTRFGDTALVVEMDSVAPLLAELERRGYMPKVVEGQ